MGRVVFRQICISYIFILARIKDCSLSFLEIAFATDWHVPSYLTMG